jgi:hypothetical protein
MGPDSQDVKKGSVTKERIPELRFIESIWSRSWLEVC